MIYGFNADEAFRIAISIEENGKYFYDRAVERTSDPDVKKVFEFLGGEEVKHKQLFTEMRARLPEKAKGSTVFDPDNEIDHYLRMMADMHVFVKSENVDKELAKTQNPQDALNLAIRFEKDSIVFFAEMQNLSEDAEAIDQIAFLVREEQSHLRKLSQELFRLQRK